VTLRARLTAPAGRPPAGLSGLWGRLLALAGGRRTAATVPAASRLPLPRRHDLRLLGETLASTHDLDRLLRVVLESARAATGAAAGAVLLLDPEQGELAGHVLDADGRETPLGVPLGEGVLGSAAATGEACQGQLDQPGPTPHPAEPAGRSYLVVPIIAPGSDLAAWPVPPPVTGVLALYDAPEADLEALRVFAGQVGVAIANVRTHEEAQRLSLTDPLTGLWNYRSLKDTLRREVERASRYRHTLTVLALDLDHFKQINDAYGHPAGDAVLAEFARRIKGEIREADAAFRQGGEEFVILLPETDAAGGAALAQRLGAAVRGQPVVIAPRGADRVPLRVSVSIGIAVYPLHALTPRTLLESADDALYAAKAAGRDTYRVATAEPTPVAAAELPVRTSARVPDHDLPQAGPGALPPRQARGG
jgi:two-component system cell cycle response regulator